MPEWRPWCRIRSVDASGTDNDGGWVGGPGRPDLGAVDCVARRLLPVLRRGEQPSLVDVDPELAELLDLAGLGGLVVEVRRQPEGGEEPLGLEGREEEAHLRDGAT